MNLASSRGAEPALAPSIERLVEALSLPEAARREVRAAFVATGARRAIVLGRHGRGESQADACDGLAVVSPISAVASAFDVGWFLVRPGDGAVERARRLLARVRDELSKGGPATLRFVGGRVHRGFEDAHLLDAAGFERRGRVAGFYGPDDDLVLFTAVATPRPDVPFDPTSPVALADAAFAYRDFVAERDFLLACARAHGLRPVRRVASWSCGSGRHLRAFAELGIDGVGIDEDPEQLDLARRLYGSMGRATSLWLESPLDAVPRGALDGPPIDLSFAMLSSCHRLSSEAALIASLRAAASLLAPGGVHVVEATHPSDVDGTTRESTIAWTELRDRFAIHSRFRLHVEARGEDGLVPAILDVRCREQGSGDTVGVLQQHERWLVPGAGRWVELVARAGGFAVAALLGDFQLDVPWDQPGAWRLLVVLRRV